MKRTSHNKTNGRTGGWLDDEPDGGSWGRDVNGDIIPDDEDIKTPSENIRALSGDSSGRPRYWRPLLRHILAGGKPIHELFADALRGDVKALSLNIHEAAAYYASDNGYSDEDTDCLQTAISIYTNSTRYRVVLAAEGSCRHDLDGSPPTSVSNSDRLIAAVSLLSEHIAHATQHLDAVVDKLVVIAKAAAPASDMLAPRIAPAAVADARNQAKHVYSVLKKTTVVVERVNRFRAMKINSKAK